MRQHRSLRAARPLAERRIALAGMAAVVALLGVTVAGQDGLAGGGPKKAAPKDTQLPEVVRLQDAVQHLPAWSKQVDPGRAFDVLVKSRGVKRLYSQFQDKLRGRQVAWVLARKDVGRNLATKAYFIEHSGGWHSAKEDLETNLRCYVDDASAKVAEAAEKEAMVLCIGKLADVEFFKDFISIGIVAEKVTIGSEAVEAWLGKQAKGTH